MSRPFFCGGGAGGEEREGKREGGVGEEGWRGRKGKAEGEEGSPWRRGEEGEAVGDGRTGVLDFLSF